MDVPFIGEVQLFAANFAPRGWALCDGQLLDINSNEVLFAILGTTYGGDGRNTFALPNLNGRTAIGSGQGPGLRSVQLGEAGGSATVSVLESNMPAHTHTVPATAAPATEASPEGAQLATTPTPHYSQTAATTRADARMVGATGGSIPVSNQQPALGLLYIIAVDGIFPSRD